MRILFVTHQFFPEHIGGTEIYTLGMAERCQNKGDNVLVSYYSESPHASYHHFGLEYGSYQSLATVKIKYNLSVDPWPARGEFSNEFTAAMVQRVLDEFKPDIVHFMHAMKISGSALEICHAKGIPYFLTMPDFWFICPRHTLLTWDQKLCDGPRSPYFCVKCLQDTHGFFNESLMNKSEAAINTLLKIQRYLPSVVASEKLKKSAMAAELRNKYLRERCDQAEKVFILSKFQFTKLLENGYDGNNFVVAPHGLETEGLLKKREPSPGQKIQLSFIASIVPHKGLHFLLEVLTKINHPDIVLNIYGNANGNDVYSGEIRNKVSDLENVYLRGTFDPADFGKVLNETDLFIFPVLWYENEPLVVKAALYCGLPVMASDIGSLRDMIQPGESGWLLPPNNLESWVDALNNLRKEHLDIPVKSSYPIYSMDDHFAFIYPFYSKIIE